MTIASTLPDALDLRYHLSQIAASRKASFLKEMYKYAALPGMTRMAEGAPSIDFMPYESLSATFCAPDDLPLTYERSPTDGYALTPSFTQRTVNLPRHTPSKQLDVTRGLAYQDSQGSRDLPPLLRDLVRRLTPPAYANWDILVHVGATDACAKVAEMFLERGDAVLVEEWTYPGTTSAFLPLGAELVGIKMDGKGLLPGHLRETLAQWDPALHGGARRPRLLYTIPTGQNPTGATMDAERKKALYEICAEYDVIICEDDPYYHLHMGAWTPSQPGVEDSSAGLEGEEGEEANQAFIKTVPPSFLEFDHQGRVIRIDTFSKILAPGTRLGWFTASSYFIERLIRTSEATTGFPSGFSTVFTTALLRDWTVEGYVRWLRGLRAGYKIRRDWLCDTLNETFHLIQEGSTLEPIAGALEVPQCMIAFDRDEAGKGHGPPIFSFIPPVGGLFVFMCIHFKSHPGYEGLATKQGPQAATAVLQTRFWEFLAENHVLLCPAQAFDAGGAHAIGGEGNGFFRMSFAPPTYAELRHAVRTLRSCLREFWESALSSQGKV